MKKVISVIMMVMAILGITVNGIASDELRNEKDIWFESIKKEFKNAVENGEEVKYRNNTYIYDGILYYTDTCWLYMSSYDYTGHENSVKETAECLENILREEGASHPQVKIRIAGEDEDTGEPLYIVEIYMMENINDFHGEKTGNGHITDGLTYYGQKMITKIYY